MLRSALSQVLTALARCCLITLVMLCLSRRSYCLLDPGLTAGVRAAADSDVLQISDDARSPLDAPAQADPEQIPEPETFVLIGTTLIAFSVFAGIVRWWRMSKRRYETSLPQPEPTSDSTLEM